MFCFKNGYNIPLFLSEVNDISPVVGIIDFSRENSVESESE